LNYSFAGSGNFQIAVTDTTVNQTEYYQVSGSGSLENIPGGTGYIIINEVNYSGNYSFNLDDLNQTGVYVQFGPMNISGQLNLYVTQL
jgi:hypothetical protein